MNYRRAYILAALTGLLVLAGITAAATQAHHPPGDGWSSYPDYPQAPDWTFKLGTYDCAPLPPSVSDIDIVVLGGERWRYKRPRGTRHVFGGSGTERGSSAWLRHAQDYVVAEHSRKHGDICTAGFRVRVNLWNG